MEQRPGDGQTSCYQEVSAHFAERKNVMLQATGQGIFSYLTIQLAFQLKVL